MWRLRKENWLLLSKKKVKTKFIYSDDAGNNKLLHWLLSSLACWLMLERRLCVYNAGLKVDTSRKILTVIMASYNENVHSCKRHTVVCRAFCFWRFPFLFLRLATYYCESWPCDSLLWVLKKMPYYAWDIWFKCHNLKCSSCEHVSNVFNCGFEHCLQTKTLRNLEIWSVTLRNKHLTLRAWEEAQKLRSDSETMRVERFAQWNNKENSSTR